MFGRTVKILAAAVAFAAAITLGTNDVLARDGGHGGGHSGGFHAAHGRGGGSAHFGGAHVRSFGGAHFGGAHVRSFSGSHFRGSHFRAYRSVHIRGGHYRGYRSAHIRGGHYAHVRGGHYHGYRSAHVRGAYGHRLSHAGVQGSRSQLARVNGSRALGAATALGGRGRWRHTWNHWGNPYWRTGWNGGWGGWAGPVFWPYFYGDLLGFVFWPYGYYPYYSYDPFWAYGDIFVWDAIFWPGPYYGPYYADAPEYYDVYGDYTYADPARRRVARRANREITGSISNNADFAQNCQGLAPGITDLPIDRIEHSLHLTDEQLKALDTLKTASSKASDALKASCSSAVSLTPVGRLDAVQNRLDGMTQALGIVRTPLDNFYNSLNDEQKRRLAELGPSTSRSRRQSTSANDLTALCSRRSQSFTQLPVQRIQDVVKPTQQQQDALDKLKAASGQAANQLQASCPTETPKGPIERFDAVSKRLDAMSAAIKTVRPALDNFYASLTDEQKARFNILGPPKTTASSHG
jgi:hypothetical protein